MWWNVDYTSSTGADAGPTGRLAQVPDEGPDVVGVHPRSSGSSRRKRDRPDARLGQSHGGVDTTTRSGAHSQRFWPRLPRRRRGKRAVQPLPGERASTHDRWAVQQLLSRPRGRPRPGYVGRAPRVGWRPTGDRASQNYLATPRAAGSPRDAGPVDAAHRLPRTAPAPKPLDCRGPGPSRRRPRSRMEVGRSRPVRGARRNRSGPAAGSGRPSESSRRGEGDGAAGRCRADAGEHDEQAHLPLVRQPGDHERRFGSSSPPQAPRRMLHLGDSAPYPTRQRGAACPPPAHGTTQGSADAPCSRRGRRAASAALAACSPRRSAQPVRTLRNGRAGPQEGTGSVHARRTTARVQRRSPTVRRPWVSQPGHLADRHPHAAADDPPRTVQ